MPYRSTSLRMLLSLILSITFTGIFSLPSGWSSLGCWTDDPGDRTLDAASYFDPVFSTIENCIQFCDQRNYPFAGAEFGRECYCDTALHNNSTQSALTDCNTDCPNNSSEICGGSARLSLFTKKTGPVLVEHFSAGLPGVWNLLGSFNNTTPNSQPFTVEAVIAGTKTTSGSVENCLTWCTMDFDCSICSISDGGVCECGNTLSPNRITTSSGGAICSLNASEVCGDHGVWQVYEFSPNEMPS